MLALDRPFIACSDTQASDEICLEYGSATQLYLVPFSLQQEQVVPPFFKNFDWVCRGGN